MSWLRWQAGLLMIDNGEEARTYFLSKAVSLFLKREILWWRENGFWIVTSPGVSMLQCLPTRRPEGSAPSLSLISADI